MLVLSRAVFLHGRGRGEAELTSTVELVIEIMDVQQFISSHLQPTFSPVLFPPSHVGAVADGDMASHVYLVDVLPPGGSKRGGQEREAVLLGILSGSKQTVLETDGASRPSFGLIFKPLDGLTPILVVVYVLDIRHALVF